MARITQNRPYFHCGPSIRVKQEKERKKRMQKYLFNEKKNVLYDR